jgi:hypothetical protein
MLARKNLAEGIFELWKDSIGQNAIDLTQKIKQTKAKIDNLLL